MRQNVAVIVPAFNEENAIEHVVKQINTCSGADFFLQPIVVNDCSTDSTAAIIEKLNCVAINLPVNLGIGGAVQTGFKYALDNNFDFAIQVDGDGQHPPAEIIKLLNAQRQSNADVVIGSRFIDGKGFQSSVARRAGINYFNTLNKILTGVKINDSTSGFRLINKKTLAVVYDYYPDDYPEPEAIVLYAKNKLKIIETPVQMLERQGGESSIGFFASIYYMWKVTLGIIFTFIRVKKN